MRVIFSGLKDLILDILTSKKAIATLGAILATILSKKYNWIDAPTMTLIIMSVSAYVLGQGWADHGKEAVKLTLAVPPITPSVPPIIATPPTAPGMDDTPGD